MQTNQKYEELAVESLLPYEKNARTHSPEQIEKICDSIKEFGFINPVLINKDNVIIAGHGRVMAAKKLGMENVPCLHVEHLTEAQMRAYVIADNKLAEQAGWDDELLKFIEEQWCDREDDETSVLFEHKPLKNDDHPTMKPISLLARGIRNSSKPGEKVLDLFGGSGSTLITCEQLGRTCYMMEYDPKFIDVIVDRWERLTGQKAVLLNGDD